MTATVRGVSVGGRSGQSDLERKREYSVTYLIRTNSASDGPNEVLRAFGVPAIGDIYSIGNDVDAAAICTSKSASQRESPYEWEVECAFSTKTPGKPENTDNPLDQPAEISFGFETRKLVVPGRYNDPLNPSASKDLDIGIINSAGELFDPQPEMEVCDPVLTIKKNMPYVSIEWLMSIANTVNEASFYGADARQLRLKPPQTNRAYDGQIGFYWPTTFEFVYRFDTWDLQILNTGSYYLDGTERKKFQMSDGTPFVGLLTAAGAALNASSEADLGRYVSTGDDPTFTRIKVYRELDFNSLGII